MCVSNDHAKISRLKNMLWISNILEKKLRHASNYMMISDIWTFSSTINKLRVLYLHIISTETNMTPINNY
jgi:hypothetical protein